MAPKYDECGTLLMLSISSASSLPSPRKGPTRGTYLEHRAKKQFLDLAAVRLAERQRRGVDASGVVGEGLPDGLGLGRGHQDGHW